MKDGGRATRFRRQPKALAPLLLIAAGAFAFSSPASALDGLRKRITPDFGEVPCMQRIALDETSEFHFDWTIDEEAEYPLGEFEAEQGQRFQFLAINRQNAGTLPDWISDADIEEIQALTMVDPDSDPLGVPPDDAIWERSPHWPADSWVRVTPDDARIEQTNDAAQLGATWQLEGVEPGAWQIVGYTWDPTVNVNTLREGLLKLVPNANEVGAPALFMRAFETAPVVAEGEFLDLSVCVDAEAGSSLRAYISRPNPNARSNEDFDWIRVNLSGGENVGQEDVELQLEVPELDVGTTFQPHRIRVDVTTPGGETYTAIAPRIFDVSQGDGQPPPPDDEQGSGGGGCRVAGEAPTALWLFALLGIRRRKA